jgi:tetratricopeptide (TPR) repeat protein
MRVVATAATLVSFCALSGAAAAVPEIRVAREVETTTCGDLVLSTRHAFLVAAEGPPRRLVDADARAWLLDSPVEYEGDARRIEGRERHRVGDGAIEVRADLALDAGRFSVEVRPEPAGDFAAALAQYLPGIALPCRAAGRISIEPAPDSPADPARFARVQDLLHRATEALYVPDFVTADALLAEAQSLEPRADTVRWMRARAHYLAGEALPRDDVAGRTARFAEAEAFADQAVELAPDRAEGWLWRGVARGRLITTQGLLERALGAVAGARGPAWVAACFERAIALRPAWRHFNHYAEGDALYGAAQLYRLLPDGTWASRLIGVRGDLDRAVALARRALAIQPNRIEYAKELGADLLCRGTRRASAGDVDEGRRVLRGAATLPVRSLYDRVDRHHVERLIAEPADRACDYSRDLWLDAAREEG